MCSADYRRRLEEIRRRLGAAVRAVGAFRFDGEGGVRFVTDELKRGGEVQAQGVKGGNVGFSGGGGFRFEPKPKIVMEMAVLGLAHGSDLGLGLEPSPRIDEESHCSSN